MRSSLEYEYSVTRVDAKTAWDSPCVRWSRGGSGARSDGGRILWLLGWVYGRGFVGYEFVNGVKLLYCDGTFLGR